MRAGIRNAGLMSLVASAQRQEIDVGMYLESAITHLLRGTARPEELLPDRWKTNHPEAVRTYREQERRGATQQVPGNERSVGYCSLWGKGKSKMLAVYGTAIAMISALVSRSCGSLSIFPFNAAVSPSANA